MKKQVAVPVDQNKPLTTTLADLLSPKTKSDMVIVASRTSHSPEAIQAVNQLATRMT